MSAVDILASVPATAAERNAVLAAGVDFGLAIGSDHVTVDAAAQALLAAVEAVPAGGGLRESARLRVIEAAEMAHAHVDMRGTMPGVPGADIAASLALMGARLAIRACNGGAL